MIKLRGFSLVEVLVGISLLLILALAAAALFQFSGALTRRSLDKVTAANLAEEAIEVAKLWRDESWANLIATKAAETPYYLVWTGADWQASLTPSLILGRFERTMVFTPVYRDGNQDVSASGTADAGSRLVSVTVSWSERGATSTYALSALIANQFNN